jgi:hypothetical protein
LESSWPGLAPRLGWARASLGHKSCRKRKTKKTNKNKKHKEKQNTQNLGTILAGPGPQNGVCVRRRIDYSYKKPSKTKKSNKNKNTKQTKTKTG